MIASLLTLALVTIAAAQTATTAPTTTTTTTTSATTGGPNCIGAEAKKVTEEALKCAVENGVVQCVAEAMVDKDDTAYCACFRKAGVCYKAVYKCAVPAMPSEADRTKAVESCMQSTKCTMAQCEEMVNSAFDSASSLAVSLPAVVLAVLGALRLI